MDQKFTYNLTPSIPFFNVNFIKNIRKKGMSLND